jgi:hypothetical protein
LSFDCAFLGINNYNVNVTIDRTYINNILALTITYELYTGEMVGDPYLTLVGKMVCNNDLLETTIGKLPSVDVDVSLYALPIQVTSITYSSPEHNLIELNKDKCVIIIARTFEKFVDNTLCVEIPPTIALSFNDIQISDCEIDQSVKNAFNIFFDTQAVYPIKSSNYTIDEYGYQTGLTAEYSVSIDLFLFTVLLEYNDGEINLTIKMIQNNEIICSIVFVKSLPNIDDIFTEKLVFTNPTITVMDCDNLDTGIITSTSFYPGYTTTPDLSAKFDYIFFNTSTGDSFIVKNVGLKGNKLSLHSRVDGALNKIDDYVSFSGDLQINCAIVNPMVDSYQYWNDEQYGKFSETTMNILSINNWPVYDLDVNQINIQLGCITP